MSRRSLVIVLSAVVLLALAALAVYLATARTGSRPRAFNVQVSGATMTPSELSARQGDRVTITVTADRAEEIHLHGYDIHFVVPAAGGSVTQTFSADKTGTYEFETESSAQHLGDLVVSP